jgi:hypothetical protein
VRCGGQVETDVNHLAFGQGTPFGQQVDQFLVGQPLTNGRLSAWCERHRGALFCRPTLGVEPSQ